MTDKTASTGPGEAEARARAMRWLGHREYSCHELAARLAQIGVEAALARDVVEVLAREGLVSDERFAEIFCRQRVERFQGPRRIRAELRARGVQEPVIATCMAEYEDQWQELAVAWVGRRAAAALDRKEKARLYRGGMNRGFTHGQIMAALDRHQRAS